MDLLFREAIVNALMHRSYREHRPTQVIRYNNRIDIINPGFSLKSEEKLGQPGSETRNPFIAAVFHDTNLAETKGSGIRAMRRLMLAAHLVPPTFESSREHNEFTARLLLHHFLDEKDLDWLQQFEILNLTDPQKQALIFVREVGAIDNQTYRQMADCDTLKASTDLRMLKTYNLFASKGKGKATYYIPGAGLSTQASDALNTQPPILSTQPPVLSTEANFNLSTPPPDLSTPPQIINTPVLIDDYVQKEIDSLKQREHAPDKIKSIIMKICKDRYLSAKQISKLLNKGEDYIKRKYLSEMIKSRDLVYLHPEMINHPEQAYLTINKH
jgi:ATP-dependent DNA helicase RecG